MYTIILGSLCGASFGYYIAHKYGGNIADKLHYAGSMAIFFALTALIIASFGARLF